MKVLMICQTDISSKESLGVSKKVLGQYKAFRETGGDTWLACMDDGKAILRHGDSKRVLLNARWKSYFTVCSFFSLLPKVAERNGIDVCYIRYPLAGWAFMRMIKGLHKVCKVVVEIPTYPYDQQNKSNHNPVALFDFFQDKLNRVKLKKYVDYIVTYSDDQSIYGIPCVNISNGIDISQIKYLGDLLEYKDDIHLIGVARVQRDHGYDRVIKSMLEYATGNEELKREIFFHIVGSGPADEELRNLTKKSGLEDRVFFHGSKEGKELEEIYAGSHIGVGILGAFRSGVKKTSALKNREYCAMGVPFFGSVEDDAFLGRSDFYKLFPNNESTIDMTQIISFYDEIRNHPEVHMNMRRYAEQNLTWEAQLEKVIHCVFNETNECR